MSTTESIPSEVFSLGSLRFYALGDRVLIEEDKFRSGYECPKCEGAAKVVCENCNGDGHYAIDSGPIKMCSGCGGAGKLTCPECNGKGGLIAVPETAQRRPTTGVVVSAGPECKVLKVGQSVMFSNFAGYVVDLERAGKSVCLRILHETEILCGMEGHLELRTLKGKQEIAVFGN